MHQYAQSNSPSQMSIHSVPQLESYGNSIDAKSRVNGGTQTWTTPCGRKIPIKIRSALPKIDTRRATEADFDNRGILDLWTVTTMPLMFGRMPQILALPSGRKSPTSTWILALQTMGSPHNVLQSLLLVQTAN